MTRYLTSLSNGLLALSLLFASPSWANSDNPVIVGVAGPAINMVYAFVTRNAGLWQKYGIDARVVVFESGSILAQAALSGQVKFSISSGPATIASRTQGADTIIVAASVNTLPYSVVAAKHITKWDQLKGKKVAVSRFGSGTDTAMRMVLKKFAVDPAKDVTILQVGTQPARVQALAAGAIDATLISPPLDLAAKKQGYNILVNIAELGIPYPQTVIETTDRFIKENPKTVKYFVKGFLEGIRYAAGHRDETKKVITTYLMTGDSEVVDATYQSYLQVTDYSGHPNLEGIGNAIDEVAQRVPAARKKKPEEFVDLRFLKELEKEGFFRQLKK
jgi:ABC-type nitrate/sulfonate/bicarbonate transport system substrate-binding protein